MSVYDTLWTVSPELLRSSGTDTLARSENQKSNKTKDPLTSNVKNYNV